MICAGFFTYVIISKNSKPARVCLLFGLVFGHSARHRQLQIMILYGATNFGLSDTKGNLVNIVELITGRTEKTVCPSSALNGSNDMP